MRHVSSSCTYTSRAENIPKPRIFPPISVAAERNAKLFQNVAILQSADAYLKHFHLSVGNIHFFDRRPSERICAYIDNGIGNCEFRNAGVCKCVVVYALYFRFFANRQLSNRRTTVESKIGNFNNAVGNYDVGQIDTVKERAFVNTR